MEPEKSRCFQNNDNNCQDVVTLKIFDQCKIQECIPVGPAISREECDCIISPDCEISPGRIILAGCPVTVPPCTRAKIV